MSRVLPAFILMLAVCPAVIGAEHRPVTYYLSPGGSDANIGTDPEKPWKTFGRIFNGQKIVQPGDTVMLMDGTYERETTGLPVINPNLANDGLPGLPITIRAMNERCAWLKGDGATDTFSIANLQYWNIEGIYATSDDKPRSPYGGAFMFFACKHLVVRRCVGAYDNRYANRHIYMFISGASSLFEECEAYVFHRHGFSIFESREVELRRCYANSREYKDIEGGWVSHTNFGGDEGLVFYGASDSIAENCIMENRTEGFNVHGGTTFDKRPGGSNNRILGCMSLRNIYGGTVNSNPGYRLAADNLYKDFLVVDAMFNGFYMRGQHNTVIENASFWNSGVHGIIADEGAIVCAKTEEGCTFAARNVITVNGVTSGIWSGEQQAWSVDYANSFGNPRNYYPEEPYDDNEGHVRHARSVAPTAMGRAACLVFTPANSNMKHAGMNGADLGPTILYRYEEGKLTKKPLWDPKTGEFPHGNVIPGLSDVPGESAFDVHLRLNVNTPECPLPAGYGR